MLLWLFEKYHRWYGRDCSMLNNEQWCLRRKLGPVAQSFNIVFDSSRATWLFIPYEFPAAISFLWRIKIVTKSPDRPEVEPLSCGETTRPWTITHLRSSNYNVTQPINQPRRNHWPFHLLYLCAVMPECCKWRPFAHYDQPAFRDPTMRSQIKYIYRLFTQQFPCSATFLHG